MEKINKVLAALFLGLSSILLILILGSIFVQQRDKEYNPETVVVNSTLAPYVNEYIGVMKANDIKIPWGNDLVLVDFSISLPNNILGIAWGMDIDNITLIGINARTWGGLSPEKRRLLVFHELSHDVFNTRHFETGLMDTPMPRYVTKYKVDCLLDELVIYLKNKK